MTSPTGEHYAIRADHFEAVVTELGATLRRLTASGNDLVMPFDADASPWGCQGQHLVPWPNRIREGRYELNAVAHQLPLTEPDRGNASHGLGLWVPWALVEHNESSVVQRLVIYPQPGWPGMVEVRLRQALSAAGLQVDVTATNLGRTTIPFGYGAHPYLSVLGRPIDQLELSLPFGRMLQVDDRLRPIKITEPTPLMDFRLPHLIGACSFDTGFTGATCVGGRWQVTLAAGQRRTTLWADSSMPWVQLFSPPSRRALAVEPMTCGPDAFNEGPTHDGVRWLAAGESVCFTWGITDAGA